MSKSTYVNPTANERIDTSVKVRKKDPLTAFLLAFLFGPLGCFYASVPLGLIMIMVTIFLTLSYPPTIVITWIIGLIVAPLEAVSCNDQKRAELIYDQNR
jgi:hypothetical protein